jgi:hypothetical protein
MVSGARDRTTLTREETHNMFLADWLARTTPDKYGWPDYTIYLGIVLTVIMVLLIHAIA